MRLFAFTFFLLLQNSIIKSLPNINNINTYQWKQINAIVQHPNTPQYMRNTVNHILYKKYETWAINKAYVFKREHKYNCRNINIHDLILYSLQGLQKATTKYNGKHSFHTYANIYIYGQLYVGLCELQSITNIPKHIRRRKEKPNYSQYKKQINTQFVGYDDYWIFDKTKTKNKEYDDDIDESSIHEIWNQVNNYENVFTKRVFHYKYNYYLEKIRSNKEISEQMTCSEESVRKHLEKMKNSIIL